MILLRAHRNFVSLGISVHKKCLFLSSVSESLFQQFQPDVIRFLRFDSSFCDWYCHSDSIFQGARLSSVCIHYSKPIKLLKSPGKK